jgi:hypothetical protein
MIDSHRMFHDNNSIESTPLGGGIDFAVIISYRPLGLSFGANLTATRQLVKSLVSVCVVTFLVPTCVPLCFGRKSSEHFFLNIIRQFVVTVSVGHFDGNSKGFLQVKTSHQPQSRIQLTVANFIVK